MKRSSGIATRLLPVLVMLAALAAPAAFRAQEHAQEDPLPSWRNGQTKLSILNFVRQVCDKSSSTYVSPEQRIATFDDGGTLSSEWPIHVNQVQMVFARWRVKAFAKQHPEWKYQVPFNYILEDDNKNFGESLKDM